MVGAVTRFSDTTIGMWENVANEVTGASGH
jgi:Flp pilus assembly pilin Flp